MGLLKNLAYLTAKLKSMSLLSRLAESQGGSEIVKLCNEINKRIAGGEKIYNYTIGDFNPQLFPIPALLEDLIVDAYRQHKTNYPPAAGVTDLRQAVSEFVATHHGIQYICRYSDSIRRPATYIYRFQSLGG
jgi:aspartate aminotransferase